MSNTTNELVQPYEQAAQTSPFISAPAAALKKKSHKMRNFLVVTGVGIAGLIGIVSATGGGDNASADSATGQPVASAPAKPGKAEKVETAKPAEKAKPAAPKMTKSQQQAIGSAKSYLEFSAFSKKGLVQQLSSDAGDGFSKADATFAVEHIKVDWNKQAAKSAESYLETSHFSRKGLIEQLESSAGSGFTHAQAVYGVDKAGL